ncbi:hypothetical protein F5144DRAFT_629967 [Chaetomium tenue]|uniref:Uncharacterized protein n=1 Tax=Chaetomium tenue TaxID=1854479 RepID=A0ACB7P9C4_9PEZI|nr:hypothetical protein F5144DRAFT_629967 [Chaetomium globosum]
MTRKSVLIIGANRAVGFNLVKAFIADSWEVTGTVPPQARVDKDPALAELEKTGIKILELDYLNEGTIERAAIAYGNRPLDILVNLGGPPPKPKHWYEQTADLMAEQFGVMTVGPIITAKHFLLQLERAADAKIVNVSSSFGSIAANTFGFFLAYRAAKAALHQSVLTMAREWEAEGRKVTTVCVDPGFLAAHSRSWDGGGDMNACIACLMRIFERITPKDNGAFLL